ncbi:SAF domain-containing protein [Ferviditalea candida]|uniref:SAF domain-containing protein n=1 Tax=Ferviditalea candida TaxID=3108399 RepID=A0ABU5ZNA5_9BACL|nr:SAF domain-containing protein [Paenibacillaceae bacterium T2]
MNKRNKRILLAVIGAIVSTWLIYHSITPTNVKKVDYVDVVEVAQKIEKNQAITDAALTIKKIPKEQYQTWMVTDKSKVVGKYAAIPLYAGDKLRQERVMDNKGEEFGPDDRTMNLALTLVDFGGLPEENQYADILAYFPPPQKGVRVGYSELVLQNVYIQKLITKDGREIDNTFSKPTAEADKKADDKVSMVPAVVTVKVSVEDSLILNTYMQNPDVSLRMIGRTDKSKNMDIMSPTSEKLKQDIRHAQPTESEQERKKSAK